MKIKRYWLRGGLAAIAVAVFLFIGCRGRGFHCFEPLLFLGYKIASIFSDDPNILSILVSSIIGYFIIGAIVGWLYGKIKNRNKIPQI